MLWFQFRILCLAFDVGSSTPSICGILRDGNLFGFDEKFVKAFKTLNCLALDGVSLTDSSAALLLHNGRICILDFYHIGSMWTVHRAFVLRQQTRFVHICVVGDTLYAVQSNGHVEKLGNVRSQEGDCFFPLRKKKKDFKM